jgi:hypothetical protein
MNKAPIDLLDAPVEVSILRDGQPLMKQTFHHTPIRFGRILDNDIVLPFDSVSRYHCELRYHRGQWALIDLKSMNGVCVNGERVTSASFEGHGEFELKPVIIQVKALQVHSNPSAQDATDEPDVGGATIPEFISPTDATLVGPDPVKHASNRLHEEKPNQQNHQPGFHASRDAAGNKRALLNVDSIELMSEPHPMIENAKARAVQIAVFWREVLISVDEFLPGEEMVIEVNGIFLRLGRVGRDRSEVRCPNGTEFSNRPGRESVLLPTSPVMWKADWGLAMSARYVPQSKSRRNGIVPLIEDELIDPVVISGLMHGAVAVANMLITPKAHTPQPVPERVAKIIMAAPTPAPVVAIATPKPTPPPRIEAKATPPPKVEKKFPVKKDLPKIAKPEEKSAPPRADKDKVAPKVAKNSPPPPGPKTAAPPAPTPKPFDASSVGALKALSMLSVPMPNSANTEKIIVRKTASVTDGGGFGSTKPSTSSMMKDLPLSEGGDENGAAEGMALKVSDRGAGYGTSGFSGKTGKRNVLGSVIGGANYTETAKTEGLTREQVMKVVQKHHTQIQQCYERSLMDDPNLAGRAEFEWEISAKGSVGSISVKETSLRNGDRLLDCVKGVFRGMKFPTAKNGSATTPTIGLPFGRL